MESVYQPSGLQLSPDALERLAKLTGTRVPFEDQKRMWRLLKTNLAGALAGLVGLLVVATAVFAFSERMSTEFQQLAVVLGLAFAGLMFVGSLALIGSTMEFIGATRLATIQAEIKSAEAEEKALVLSDTVELMEEILTWEGARADVAEAAYSVIRFAAEYARQPGLERIHERYAQMYAILRECTPTASRFDAIEPKLTWIHGAFDSRQETAGQEGS